MDALTGLILRLSVASIFDNREYALAMGRAIDYRESCENLLIKGGSDGEGMGRVITIVIGGAQESLDALSHSIRLVLKRRKGFIKLANRTGADYVCVFVRLLLCIFFSPLLLSMACIITGKPLTVWIMFYSSVVFLFLRGGIVSTV